MGRLETVQLKEIIPAMEVHGRFSSSKRSMKQCGLTANLDQLIPVTIDLIPYPRSIQTLTIYSSPSIIIFELDELFTTVNMTRHTHQNLSGLSVKQVSSIAALIDHCPRVKVSTISTIPA